MGELWCDDGNLISGDGCDSTCHIETGYHCGGGSPYSHDICTEICGDGLNLLTYECDDGNTLDGDGCDSKCRIEANYTCLSTPGLPDVCEEICGNGRRLS